MSMNFQSPKGTRDFYPAEMTVRRYIEDIWRRVSIRHGFVEVDGPTFELLDLYKVKSGDEIVSQLFHFQDRGERDLALRPEFTPTLARMVAAKANALPRPIKWFSIPRCYRAEAPQKGRLREFIQWNVDFIGGDTPEARRQFDYETLAMLIDTLREFGLTSSDVKAHWNDRALIENLLACGGVPKERIAFGLFILDRLAKLNTVERAKAYAEHGCSQGEAKFFEKLAQGEDPLTESFWTDLPAESSAVAAYQQSIVHGTQQLDAFLAAAGMSGWAKYDASIVRGLAYYTGFVFEVLDQNGSNRACAGGGRYDKLIELFGGPSLPAVGFGMGDVVLEIILKEKGKMPQVLSQRPDVFIVNAMENADAATALLMQLRGSARDEQGAITAPGLFALSSYKSTKNIGKLLQDASASGARFAVILAPAEMAKGNVKIKDMQTREEKEAPLADVRTIIQTAS